MFLKEGVGGYGRIYIIYIRAREKGRKGTQSLFYLPYPLKGHSTPSNSSVIGGEQFQR